MASEDPCAKARKRFEEQQDRMNSADDALKKAWAREVTPLQMDINDISGEITRLKRDGDPNGRIPVLENDRKVLNNRLAAAKQKPDVRNAAGEYRAAQDGLKLAANELADCEKRNPSAPQSVEPPTPRDTPSDERSDAGAEGGTREHQVGDCWCGATHPDHIWFQGPCWCGKEGIHNVGTRHA